MISYITKTSGKILVSTSAPEAVHVMPPTKKSSKPQSQGCSFSRIGEGPAPPQAKKHGQTSSRTLYLHVSHVDGVKEVEAMYSLLGPVHDQRHNTVNVASICDASIQLPGCWQPPCSPCAALFNAHKGGLGVRQEVAQLLEVCLCHA
mmetsp:Transcript_39394/g.117176  ORF Transcript_39394/g.117176 Transcript_39394/m.117176 type:complete len:147 (+) Transcript_39394:798-1238(+)|eukprot:355016-Chlamydomonas_euryale.AAC.5